MCSPEQIRTADFQLRRLTFYPAELRDQLEHKSTELRSVMFSDALLVAMHAQEQCSGDRAARV